MSQERICQANGCGATLGDEEETLCELCQEAQGRFEQDLPLALREIEEVLNDMAP